MNYRCIKQPAAIDQMLRQLNKFPVPLVPGVNDSELLQMQL